MMGNTVICVSFMHSTLLLCARYYGRNQRRDSETLASCFVSFLQFQEAEVLSGLPSLQREDLLLVVLCEE